jgi:signal transduction histidine kinase
MLLQQSRQAAMGEMIGNIAHQWRQPLNALGLTIQQLLLMYDLGEFNREFLNKSVLQSVELIRHMSRTIDDFRNYFRPDKEKVEFKVSEAILTTVSLIEDSFKNQYIDIEVVAKSDPTIYGYRNEFAQALLNILNNARDVLIEREIKYPKVTVIICGEANRALLTVTDNAGGIPEEIMDRIFDPYFTTKGPQAGTGVGLFMSKTIIEKNMGGILAARNITDGAEFRIEV